MSKFFSVLFRPRTILSFVVVIVAIVLFFILRKIGHRFEKQNKDADQSSHIGRSVVRILDFLLIFGTFLTVLQINDVNITSMIAGLGLASAIVGLALQDILKDVIMGAHILSDRFFTVGDCVEFEGREGIVSGFSMTSTKITDLDDQSVFSVCNRDITKIRRLEQRMDLDIPIGYNEDPEKVSAVLQNACRKIAESEQVSECRLKGIQLFGESSVLYRIRILCEPKYRPGARRRALSTLRTVLNEAGIAIPFNQLDVHLKK